LSVFAIGYGWVGMPEWFTGGLVPNWFHEFVGSTLAVIPESPVFSIIPLLTSLVVALGGLLVGWLVYRRVRSAEQDILQIPVLKNKWYFDEIYSFLFVKPAYWFAETFVLTLMDKGLIDGILHMFGQVTTDIGSSLRNYIDKPVINSFFGDGTSALIKWIGRSLRPIQSGRIQQYMLVSLLLLLAIAGLIYYFMMRV